MMHLPILTKAYRWYYRMHPHKKPSSYPYISGDTFRQLANHIFDEVSDFNPADVQREHIIFVRTDYIRQFFREKHPFITQPYKLITHNSDAIVGPKEIQYVDDKIIRWFAQNVTVQHERVTPIPIGLENKRYYQNGVPKYFIGAQQKQPHKINRIMYGFNEATNPTERIPLQSLLKQIPIADHITTTPRQHTTIVQRYKFIVAPEGNGPDTHRIWEALALGTIPIVKRNVFLEYFHELGLPLLFVNDWEELSHYDESSLEKKYNEIMARCGATYKNLLAYHYWQGIIRSDEAHKNDRIVCVAIGDNFNRQYQKLYKKTHEHLAFDLQTPLVVIEKVIESVPKRLTWQKLVMFKTPLLAPAQRVMLLDADIYIKDTSINPFTLVPPAHWGLAPNNAFNLATLAVSDLTLYNHCPSHNRPHHVMNCGFFIINQDTHRACMEYVFANYGEQICDEQGPFCYHLLNEYPGTLLPRTLNNIVGSFMDAHGYSMTSVIQLYNETNFFHFAGKGNKKILWIVHMMHTYPLLHKILSQRHVLYSLDMITKLIKKIKRI